MNPVWLIAVPLALAFISTFANRISNWLLFLSAIFNAVAGIFLSFSSGTVSYSIGGWRSPFGIDLIVTDATRILLPVANILFFFAVIIHLSKKRALEKFSVVYTISLASLNGILLTNDLFNLFVFLEIAGVAAYLLAMTGKEGESKVAAFKYLLLGSVGSLLYLLGVAVLYAAAGTLNISAIATKVSDGLLNGDVMLVSSLLMIAGLGVESKLVPFNGWVPGVFTKSSNMATLVLASVYPVAMISTFSRVILAVGDRRALDLVIVLGVATVLIGEVIAFKQRNLRSTLTYSSIAQSGLAIFLVGIGTIEALTASVMLIINNALAKFVLFSVDSYTTEELGADDLESLYGLGKVAPVAGLIFTVSALSISGMPLFLGFRAKLLAISSSFESLLVVPIVILLAAAIEITYYFRWIFALYRPYKGEERARLSLPLELMAIGVVLAAILVFLGSSSHETLMAFSKAGNAMVDAIITLGKNLIGGV